MSSKKKKGRRPATPHPYRKMFVISTEGRKTEPAYFETFNDRNTVLQIRCLKGQGNSAPPQVLRRMKKHLEKEQLRRTDEAWIVVDKDQWTDAQLSQLRKWAQESGKHGFALSNPSFEFWLLLHFEEGRGVRSARDCSRKLNQHLPGYDKDINLKFPPAFRGIGPVFSADSPQPSTGSQ